MRGIHIMVSVTRHRDLIIKINVAILYEVTLMNVEYYTV